MGTSSVTSRVLTYLIGGAGEVVGRLESTTGALLKGGITTVIGTEDGVLESPGVGDVNIQLAILALLGNRNARTNRGNVRVEDESDRSPVSGELGAHGSLWASGPAIGDAVDFDLLSVNACIGGRR